MSQYDTEAANNNKEASRLLQSVFPDLFSVDVIDTLMKVREGVQLVRSTTGIGSVIVHIKPEDTNVEFRGTFPSRQEKPI